jgi:hypothetical protein
MFFESCGRASFSLFYMSLAAFAIGAACGGESTLELEARARPPTKKNAAPVV